MVMLLLAWAFISTILQYTALKDPNKRLWLSIGCTLLVAYLLYRVILWAGFDWVYLPVAGILTVVCFWEFHYLAPYLERRWMKRGGGAQVYNHPAPAVKGSGWVKGTP